MVDSSITEKLDRLQLEDIDNISDELDNLCIQLLGLMEQLIIYKSSLDETMKNGSINLAKARYIMGNKRLSALQLPFGNEVVPQVTIFRDENVDKMPILSLNRIGIQTEGLRQRIDTDQTKNNDDKSIITANKNPLNWFGVLVPQNLRQAQTEYVKAIDLAVEVANIQIEIKLIENKYKKLFKKKSELALKKEEFV